MPVAESWLLFSGTLICTVALTWPLRAWLLRQRLLDLPGARRSHQQPTPRGGGVAILVSLALAWSFWPGAAAAWRQPMMLVILLGLLGWIEDRGEVPRRLRLVVQLLAATAFLWLVGGIEAVRVLHVSLAHPWLWSLLGVIAVVWLVNLYNFMDGSDGLAAAQGLWGGLLVAALFHRAGETALAQMALAGAGAWGGFLLWNRPPARIFMGDSGSLALGAMMAACAVLGAVSGAFSIWVGFMVSSLFVVDATATLLCRVIRGERWYTAHRQHAYQRLLDLGLGHGRVLVVYMLINVLLVLPLVAASLRWPQVDALLAAGLAVILTAGWQVVQSAAKVNNDKA